jgi:hypothetical protein
MAARQPTPTAQLAAFMSRFSPEIIALAKRCLSRLRRSFPGSYELVYDYPGSLLVAFGTSERGYEAIVSVAVFQREVRLYFRKSVPDPKRILKGSGSKVRSVTLKSASDLNHGDVRGLIEAAIKESAFRGSVRRPTCLVIKSRAKKRQKS